MSRVLVLRDAAAGAETAAALAALGHEPLLLPLAEILPLAAAPPEGPFAGIVATSHNALPALVTHFAGTALPVLAVGRGTARQMAAAGFMVAHVGEGSAADLLAPAARLGGEAGLPLLLALGRVRTAALEEGLAAAGADFRLWETYDTRALEPDAENAARVLGDAAPDAALLLSKAQAEGFAALVARAPDLFRPVPRLFCLSERIAGALPKELRRFASISPGGDVSTLFAGLA